MKRNFILILFLMFIANIGFAQSVKSADNNNGDVTSVEQVVSQVSNKILEAPASTTYGVVENTPEKYVVNTPFGKYDVEKKNGGYSFLGIFAKIESKKGNVYIVDSSLGKFKVDINKCSISKL